MPSEEALLSVDPELRPLIALLPRVDLANAEGLRATRDAFAKFNPPVTEGDGVRRDELRVPGLGDAPPIRIVVYRSESATGALPAILHMHSGGFVLGSPEARETVNRHWAKTLRCEVVSVDYRLSPETAYPGALEDCYAVLSWMNETARERGIDPAKIVAMGESAGGNLAAALALLARDRGEFALAGQVLAYPMLDDRETAGGHRFVWTAQDNSAAWDALLGGQSIVDCPYAAPARIEDLRGLPPCFIAVGALDLFLAEDTAFATRLAQAGVAVELHVYPGAFHAFDAVATAAVTQAFRRDCGMALARFLKL